MKQLKQKTKQNQKKRMKQFKGSCSFLSVLKEWNWLSNHGGFNSNEQRRLAGQSVEHATLNHLGSGLSLTLG